MLSLSLGHTYSRTVVIKEMRLKSGGWNGCVYGELGRISSKRRGLA